MILNIAGYRFISLADLTQLQRRFKEQCEACDLLGTILLSNEGININMAGTPTNVQAFKDLLGNDSRFANMRFHECESDFLPFNFLKIKIKPEIITMRTEGIHPEITPGPDITPQEFKRWMDEKRDFTILDTRNDYEVQFGTFENAINPQIEDFCEFKTSTQNLDQEKPVVMFCTGGIRCEKASLYLLQNGFKEVYQLQGGILNYFKEVGGDHFNGDCFVFDERTAVDTNLAVSGTQMCKACQGPVRENELHVCR